MNEAARRRLRAALGNTSQYTQQDWNRNRGNLRYAYPNGLPNRGGGSGGRGR